MITIHPTKQIQLAPDSEHAAYEVPLVDNKNHRLQLIGLYAGVANRCNTAGMGVIVPDQDSKGKINELQGVFASVVYRGATDHLPMRVIAKVEKATNPTEVARLKEAGDPEAYVFDVSGAGKA